MAMVLHDGPDGGRAVVGGLTHFGFALLDAKGRLVEHQDATFVVTQEGVILFSSDSTHEYDGLFSLDLTFTRPGPYEVAALSGDMAMGNFTGVAVMPVNETAASIRLALAPAGPAGNAVTGLLEIVDASGNLLPHTDAIVEVRTKAERRLVSRAHLHIHDEPIAFTQALGLPGDYIVGVTGYLAFPTGRGADIRAVTAEFPATAGPIGLPSVPAPAAAADPLGPRGATTSAGGYTLQGMYDPQPLVGIGNVFRLSALVTDDATALPKAHVDFEMELRGPRGVVFSSKSLHEYDGMFEYAYAPDAPGAYEALLTAIVGDTRLSIPFHVQVAPPAVALDPGPKTVAVAGLDTLVAGVPGELIFTIAGPSGPLGHSEVDVTIHRAGEAALYQFKLHAHGDGTSRALVTFPLEGEWLVVVDPIPLMPQPSPVSGPGGSSAPIVFAASVAPGLAQTSADAVGEGAPAAVPGLGVGIVVAVLLGVAMSRRT